MVKIRRYEDKDFEEVLLMYYDLATMLYNNHNIKPIEDFKQNVENWIIWDYDIMLTYNNDEVTGFTLCYFDNMGGIVDYFYQFEIAYIKEKYRKGRSAIAMYNHIVNYAQDKGMILAANASDLTDASILCSKLGTKTYTHYERKPND